jgi:hypothetical protein
MNREEHEAVGLDIFVISRKLVDNKVFLNYFVRSNRVI